MVELIPFFVALDLSRNNTQSEQSLSLICVFAAILRNMGFNSTSYLAETAGVATVLSALLMHGVQMPLSPDVAD